MALPDTDDLSPVEVQAIAGESPALFIDVREINEYAIRHIGGSLLLPMSVFDPEDFPRVPGVPIVLVCSTGKRSGSALKMLRNAKFPGPLYNLAGGLVAWTKAGLPVIEAEAEDFSI